MNVYDSIKQRLTEAIDFAQDKPTEARVHRVGVPQVDVAALGARTGLSQAAFAHSVGVAQVTLLN